MIHAPCSRDVLKKRFELLEPVPGVFEVFVALGKPVVPFIDLVITAP